MHFGLEEMLKGDAALGFPSKACPCIHVGGTNGKGSTATKIAASLQAAGLKVGLYTSPHIATFRERIRVNGAMIAESEALCFLNSLQGQWTFFEAMTLLAFTYFAKEKCDVTVLEVGMGGRLDATNIVTPLLSIVTSISCDHTLHLGNTLSQIAEEKAGIIKPGVPFLVGPQAARFPIFKQKAHPYFEVTGEFTSYEEENRAVAAKALSLLPFPYDSRGLEVTPPCRFEVFAGPLPLILDVAHNPEGMERLFARVKSSYPGKKVHALLGLGKDKEVEAVLNVLERQVSFLQLTQAVNERAELPEALASKLKTCPFSIQKDISQAFEEAKERAIREEAVLVVTGTFYIMSVVRRLLGVVEPKDEYTLTPY